MNKRIELNGVDLWLLPERALYIPEEKALIISDWHLGKLRHFRSEGLFVPDPGIGSELERLDRLLKQYAVTRLIFLGDLFHSRWNKDWDTFKSYATRLNNSGIKLELTRGNHDILDPEHFRGMSMLVSDSIVFKGDILLSHDRLMLRSPRTQIVGHIHPGCLIDVGARQSFKLPCFHLQDRILTLPAFGLYTGLHILKKTGDSRLFPIVTDCVLELP
ncbi:MAG: ligase-associated DNA damage response endonuclease PdeM [Sphingobacteriaceae bacterium]